MKTNFKTNLLTALLMVLISIVYFCILPTGVWADGTETLGDPSIAIAQGTGIVAAGVGLQNTQPGAVSIDIPGSVVQVLLYWGGAATDLNPADDTITVNGTEITGTLIGGPAFFFTTSGKQFFYSNYRADITGLGLVASGANNLIVEGLDNKDADGNGENSGAGILVIFDDGSGIADIGIKDGLDLAFAGFPEPRMSTVPQTFIFTPASIERTADLVIFAGSVGPENRTSIIRITVDGTITNYPNLLASVDGDLWDTLTIPIIIPADEGEITVEIISGNGTGNPASLNWIGAGLAVTPEEEGGEGCTPGYWKNHLDSWGPTGLSPDDDFDTTFGVDYFDPDITLDDAINLGGGHIKKVARHGTAALLNALHPAVDYPATPAEVIAAVQAGDVEDLSEFNELSDECPAEDYDY